MSRERTEEAGAHRGFASMDRDKQREIARKGGANVPHEKRSFAQDRALAAEAGRKGGQASPGGSTVEGTPAGAPAERPGTRQTTN